MPDSEGDVLMVFRNGPTTMTPTSGSVASGSVQLEVQAKFRMTGVYIPAPVSLRMADGRFELQVPATPIQTTPSGKGWQPLQSSSGQLSPRSKVRRF